MVVGRLTLNQPGILVPHVLTLAGVVVSRVPADPKNRYQPVVMEPSHPQQEEM